MRWSNCYLFVFRQWWRYGGNIVLRQSLYGWWLHAYWTDDYVTFLHFAPDQPRARYFPPLLFRGRVKQWTRRSDAA